MSKLFKFFFNIIIIVIFVSGVWVVPKIVYSAESMIAVVNVEKALSDCSQGKKANVELQHKAARLQTELKDMNDSLIKLRKELESSGMLLKPEIKLVKERDFERKVRNMNDRSRDAQLELEEARQIIFDPLAENMGAIIREIGLKSNYSLIIDSRMLLYFSRNIDVTPQVISAYDNMYH